MRSAVIVQPYLPTYRVPLFAMLDDLLRDRDVSLSVVTGTPISEQAARRDAALGLPWQVPTGTHSLMIGSRWLRTYHSQPHWKDSDCVVLELASGAADTYRALMGNHLARPVGVWGHVVEPRSLVDRTAITWQLTRASHVFAYTAKGAERAAKMGARPEIVTVVGNSLETDTLEAAIAAVRSDDIAAFRSAHGLSDGPVFAYIGGLDKSKRISFMVEALDRLYAEDPNIHLIIGGEGQQRSLLEAAVARGQVSMLGRVEVATKAVMLATAMALVCPGRVGLLAVESLVSGTPIVTTDWRGHAPEFDYLTRGVNCLITADDCERYASALLSVASDSDLVANLSAGCLAAKAPRLADAARHLADGIVEMLN